MLLTETEPSTFHQVPSTSITSAKRISEPPI